MKKYIEAFMQYRYFLKELVKKAIKLKYRRSYLGIVWTLVEPLLAMIVLTIVFGTLFGRDDQTFPVYILTGRLLYSMFSHSTGAAMRSIRANSGMIKRVYVPRYMYPLSAVLSSYVTFLLSLVVLAVVSIVMQVYPTWYLLQAVVPLSAILLLSLGVGLILSTFAVFFRDLEYLWNVVQMLIMYTSAIFYRPERLLNSEYSFMLTMNPLHCIIDNFRSAVFGSPMNTQYVLYSLGFSTLSLLIGLFVFYKYQDDFVLHI